MFNEDFIIHGGNFNSFSGSAKNPQGKKLDFTSGETAPAKNQSPSFRVNSGFQYLRGEDSFTFSVSSAVINFGDIQAGEPVTRSNKLSVTARSAPGYQVLASEDHEPQISAGGASIPDTTCDDGNCSETTSALWTSPLTYGFGYRCDNLSGTACDEQFKSDDFFKQFSNSSKNESSQTVMSDANPGKTSESEITYKINVPQTQPSGLYQNNILYIAVPNL